MAANKLDEVVIKVPQGVKTVKIEFDGKPSNESNRNGGSRKKICD